MNTQMRGGFIKIKDSGDGIEFSDSPDTLKYLLTILSFIKM